MSGELDERPDLTAIVRDLRDRVYELEHRVSGDANPLALNDLEDVRVDSLGDATITLADGDALVYRAADELWIPGATSGGSGFPIRDDDGSYTNEIFIEPGGASGGMKIQSRTDPAGVYTPDYRIYFYNGGGIEFEDYVGGGTFFDDFLGGGLFFTDHDGGGVFFDLSDAGGFFVDDRDGGGIFFDTAPAGGFFVNGNGGDIRLDTDGVTGFIELWNLPTANPGGGNRVWNDSGTLKIT